MAKNGLDKWFAQKWVDIGSKRKDFKGRKPAMVGGMMKRASYMGGGLTEATQRLKRQGLKKGSKGSPTKANFVRAAQTARKR